MSTEAIVRGPEAVDATVARFNVDLRGTTRAPTELTERVRAQARATGYAEGWGEGHQAAQLTAQAVGLQQAASARLADLARAAAFDRAVAAVVGAVGNIERRVVLDVAALEDRVLQTAWQIAETLLGRELAISAEPGRDALRRAMSLVPPDGPVTVLLNPDDYLILTGSTASECEQVHNGRPVLLRPSPGLAAGDALAECAMTTVDARLASAVERVRKALEA
jgi:flagellar assembly protein FliH